MRNTLTIILLFALTYCNSHNAVEADKQTLKDTTTKITTEQYLTRLMDSLSLTSTAEQEKHLMEKIWEYSNPELHDDIISLSLSVVDEKGNQVANNISKAKGEVKATITIGKERLNWSKSVTIVPKNKDNLYALMLE